MNQQTVQALSLCVQLGQPVLLWGDPGVGKTSGMYSLFKALNLPLEVVIASVREPADFGGYPMQVDGNLEFAPPGWAVRTAQQNGGVFFDEVNTAPPTVQAALLRVLLEKVVGDFALPKGTPMVAAANPPEVAAGGWELPLPTANRFVHLKPPFDTDAWCHGMLYGWPSSNPLMLAKEWETQVDRFQSYVIGFLKANPTKANVIPQNPQGNYAYPSPRTWEVAIKLLAASTASKASSEVQNLLVAGAIGDSAAIEFMNYCKSLDLPDPEALLANPQSFRKPPRQDQLYVIFGSLASRVLTNNTKERFEACMQVALEAQRQDAAIDVLGGCLLNLVNKKPAGSKIPQALLEKLAPLVGLGDL